jgi:hypothetical protein
MTALQDIGRRHAGRQADSLGRPRLDRFLEQRDRDDLKRLEAGDLFDYLGLRCTFTSWVSSSSSAFNLPHEPPEAQVATEASNPAAAWKLPSWNPETGELRWQNKEIGSFQIRTPPTDFAIVLQAFEHAHWQMTIPRPTGIDAAEIYGVLYRLNDRVERISFHVTSSREKIFWRSNVK